MANPARTIAALLAASIVWLAGAANAEESPTLRKVGRTGVLTLGYREAAIPFSYADADGKPIGFALDLCALIAERVKQRLRLAEIKVDAKPVTPANRAALIKDGGVDLDCGATAQTVDLAREAAFSIPIYASELKWLVLRHIRVDKEGGRGYEVKALAKADDLRGLTVAVVQGSPALSAMLTLSVDRFLGLSILEGKDAADAFRLVETGTAAAMMDDDAALLALKAGAKNPDWFGFLDESFPAAPYALAIRKDDKAFKDLVDGVLADAMKSGDFARLYTKWFESPIPPKNINLAYPMPEKLKQLIKELAQDAN